MATAISDVNARAQWGPVKKRPGRVGRTPPRGGVLVPEINVSAQTANKTLDLTDIKLAVERD